MIEYPKLAALLTAGVTILFLFLIHLGKRKDL